MLFPPEILAFYCALCAPLEEFSISTFPPKEWLIKCNYALVPHSCVLKVPEGKKAGNYLNLGGDYGGV